MRLLLVLLCLICSESFAQYPDGTLILSSKKGLIGRVAKRMTCGDQYTHIAIIIDQHVYEQDFPRSKATPLRFYKYKRRSTNDFYIPITPFTHEQTVRMKRYADAHLGEPYQLRNYLNPRSRKTRGTWCSTWVGRVLNSSGRFDVSRTQSFEPQNLLDTVRPYYNLKTRKKK